MTGTFVEGIAAFTAVLREQHGFGVGHAATRDALRAADVVGVADGARLRRALRAVYCATPQEAARFDEAFDAFFFGAHGIAQPKLRAERTRAGTPRASSEQRPPRTPPDAPRADEGNAPSRPHAIRRARSDGDDGTETWQALRARYSASAGRSSAPVIPLDGLDRTTAAVDRLAANLRIAPSRRRAPHRRGDRADVRRTLRASVATAGEPIDLRRTRRLRRRARFVALIDGSRSNADDAGAMLQFAYALVQRTRDARAFTFSTALRDVTALLRDPHVAGRSLGDLGDAWGGGTRIGDAVLTFVREQGTRALSPSTIVFLFSDGLDVGNLDRLARGLRELRARSAAIVWLHPGAGAPAFMPAAGGLRTARPYVDALYAAGSVADLERVVTRMTKTMSR